MRTLADQLTFDGRGRAGAASGSALRHLFASFASAKDFGKALDTLQEIVQTTTLSFNQAAEAMTRLSQSGDMQEVRDKILLDNLFVSDMAMSETKKKELVRMIRFRGLK